MTIFSELLTLAQRQKQLGLIGIKSEFESEGVRRNEFTIVNALARKAGLMSVLKVGGAEAKSDMFFAQDNMCDYVVAPMIETPYAAKKCIEAFSDVLRIPHITQPKLLVNIETASALSNINSIIDTILPVASGIVFGRVDFTLSSGLSRSDIQSATVSDAVLLASEYCKQADLEFVVGGGISVDSIDLLRALSHIRLDRFETRKCVIDVTALNSDIHTLLKDCVRFELLWLKFKSSMYSVYSEEDISRISMLEQRHLYNISSCND